MDTLRVCAWLLTAVATGANAAITVFTDESDFNAHALGLTTLDFGGLAPNNSFVSFNTPQGLTLAGVNFVGISGTQNILHVVDDGFCCTPYRGRIGNVASLASSVSGATTNSRIVASLPPGVTALGMELFSVTRGDDGPGTQTDVLRVTVDGETFQVPTVGVGVGSGLVFFGVTSSTPIASIIIAPTRFDRATAAEVASFAFGTAAPVPLPAAVYLLAGAVGCLVSRRGVTRAGTSRSLGRASVSP